MKVTIEDLRSFSPHAVFAMGYNHIEGTETFKWVAKRGLIDDWAMYFGSVDLDWDELGEKIRDKKTILRLLPCDEEVIDRYRFR